MNKNRAIIRTQKLLVYMHKPPKSFLPLHPPRNNLIRPKKAQNGPEITLHQTRARRTIEALARTFELL